jgi:hypothetical protein
LKGVRFGGAIEAGREAVPVVVVDPEEELALGG